MLQGRHVVVGVCGGIAAYKSVELCRRLTDEGARVSVVMTDNAQRFVGRATFAALTDGRVFTSLWDEDDASPHTTLAQSADVVVVAPATARMIGDYANGISSDLLVSTLIATRAPVVVAPAMHTEMWEHPAVIANIETLRDRRVVLVDPESGALAGGDHGIGRLAATESILSTVSGVFSVGDLAGKRVLVTAGGTREPIDPVRYISNRSSGKQGYAIAEEAASRGAKVVLVTTVDRMVSSDIDVVSVETAAEMNDAVMARLPDIDVVVMAAAVADFAPAEVALQKLKKSGGVPELQLVATADILAGISANRNDSHVIVGFAAETNNVAEHAMAKLQSKNLDLIVANDVSEAGAGFAYDSNRVVIVDKYGRQSVTELISKRKVAQMVLDDVVVLLNERHGSTES